MLSARRCRRWCLHEGAALVNPEGVRVILPSFAIDLLISQNVFLPDKIVSTRVGVLYEQIEDVCVDVVAPVDRLGVRALVSFRAEIGKSVAEGDGEASNQWLAKMVFFLRWADEKFDENSRAHTKDVNDAVNTRDGSFVKADDLGRGGKG